MKKLNYLEALAPMTDKLSHGGIFLTVPGEKPNTMTIGWASAGFYWGKPVFVALVRPQRHTYGLIEKAGEFTISVPTKNPLRAELAFAGTKSGRDFDKFDGHGLTAAHAQVVNTPIIAECGLHFECKILYRQEMSENGMCPEVLEHAYPQRDFHTMYYGEIVACYSTDE